MSRCLQRDKRRSSWCMYRAFLFIPSLSLTRRRRRRQLFTSARQHQCRPLSSPSSLLLSFPRSSIFLCSSCSASSSPSHCCVPLFSVLLLFLLHDLSMFRQRVSPVPVSVFECMYTSVLSCVSVCREEEEEEEESAKFPP